MISRSIVPLPGEIWKDIPWTNGVYQVSDKGRVRRIEAASKGTLRRCCFICDFRMHKSYPYVRLKFDGRTVFRGIHQLVAEAFDGPRPAGLIVNHKNGVKTFCEPANLEYVTYRENNLHAIQTGLRKGPYKKRVFVGVHRNAKRSCWHSQITFQRKTYYLGMFVR